MINGTAADGPTFMPQAAVDAEALGTDSAIKWLLSFSYPRHAWQYLSLRMGTEILTRMARGEADDLLNGPMLRPDFGFRSFTAPSDGYGWLEQWGVNFLKSSIALADTDWQELFSKMHWSMAGYILCHAKRLDAPHRSMLLSRFLRMRVSSITRIVDMFSYQFCTDGFLEPEWRRAAEKITGPAWAWRRERQKKKDEATKRRRPTN